jgi:hypothetical protein
VYEHECRAYLDEHIQHDGILDKVIQGLEWRISRDPLAGEEIEGWEPRYYIIKKTYRLPVPSLIKLLYHFTDDNVYIELAEVRNFHDE